MRRSLLTLSLATLLVAGGCPADPEAVNPDTGDPLTDVGPGPAPDGLVIPDPGTPDGGPATDPGGAADPGATTDPGAGQDPGAGGDGGNTAPTFAAPAQVTLAPGESRDVDLTPYIADAEDADAALVVSWTATNVTLADPDGDHTVTVTAPTDWTGTEAVALTVTDSGGLTATAAWTIKVEDEGDCGLVSFAYDAGVGGASEVLLSGSFNGWGDSAATADVMTDADGDGVWEITRQLTPGTHQYKFIVDGTWLADPTNPTQVDDGNGGFNSVVAVACGGADDATSVACGEATFVYLGAASEVLVSGSFNGWGETAATADALTSAQADGVWSVTVSLDPGSHQYKYIVDGSWILDPTNPQTVDDGGGNVNSQVTVPECGRLAVTSHSTTGGTFTATLSAGEPVAPGDVEVTVDRQAAPAGAVTADGDDVALTLEGLADGIHDVRVTHDGRTTLLKVYVGLDPDWRDAVIYFAMTDRFLNGDPDNDAPMAGVDSRTNYQGGDFAGLQAKIDDGYFTELGVGALWISWPIDNPDFAEPGARPSEHACGLNPATMATTAVDYTGYHGYWPSQLDQVEEHFGTLEELQALVDAAHAKGIRVLLDFTANHVHDSSPLYAAHQGDGYFNLPAEICQEVGWDVKPKTCWFVDYLPDLNYTSAAARKAVVDHAVAWVHLSGADGFRFDAVKHLEMSFVQDLRARTKAEFEQTDVPFYIVGETFTGDAGLIQSFIGPDKIHGQFDFPTNMQILKGFATQELGLADMDAAVRGAKGVYTSQGELMSTFIGNHDIARFISMAAGDISCGVWDVVANIAQGWLNPPGTSADAGAYARLRLALTYAYTIPGLPLLYYGDELGLPGAGDPDNRRLMIFDGALSSLQAETLAFSKALGQARAAHVSLRRGSWSGALAAEADLLAYARQADGETAVVLLNRGDATKTGSVTVSGFGVADGTTLTDALGSGASGSVAGGQLSYSVPAGSAQILVTP